jgi:WD40 repeat protein
MSQKTDFISKLRGPISSVTIFQPGERSCNRACISPAGDLLFVATDKVVVGYNLMTETCFKIYRGHDGAVEDLDIESDGKRIVSVGNSQHIIIHNVEDGTQWVDKDEKKILQSCCFAPGLMHYIATVTSKQLKQKIVLSGYHFAKNDLIKKWDIDFDTPINTIKWPNASTIVAGDEKGRIHVINVTGTSVEELSVIDAHRGSILNITISFDNNLFATASSDTTASLWTVPQTSEEKPKKVGTYNHNFIVSCAAIAPKAPHIVLASSADASNVARTSFGSTDFTINFFHTIFQEEFASMKVHKSTVNWVGFTPDGHSLVTTSFEGTVQVIRLGGQYEKIVKQHDEEIQQIKNEIDNE